MIIIELYSIVVTVPRTNFQERTERKDLQPKEIERFGREFRSGSGADLPFFIAAGERMFD